MFDPAPAVVGTEWEPYVAAVIQVERSVHTFHPATGLWKTSDETSFYGGFAYNILRFKSPKTVTLPRWAASNPSVR